MGMTASRDIITTDQVIGGRYLLESVLGRGGFGTVFHALQAPLDRPVAVKVCHSTAEDTDAQARFEREARIIAGLRSPHTVRLYDYGQTESGFIYFAMEYISGTTLQAELAMGPVEPTRTARIISEVCESLAEAHHQNVLHLDLKPANIMVESISGRGEMTRVLDFGIARIRESGSEAANAPGPLVGTPRYMAPEFFRGEAITQQSDLYALGLMLDECLRGRATFTKANTPLVLAQHFDDIPALPERCPPGLIAIRDQLLKKDPGDRPPSAESVRQQLDLWRLEYKPDVNQRWTRSPDLTLSVANTMVLDESAFDHTMQVDEQAINTLHDIEIPSFLPFHATRFVGRGEELNGLRAAFGSARQRMVTLAGPGGAGKTRLATQYAQESQRDYLGGVWLCDLSETRSIDDITAAVAQVLDVPLRIGEPIEQLAKVLSAKPRCLLILDNFEQVVEHAEAVVGVWLRWAPQTRFLITSREALRVPGEHILSVSRFPTEDAVALFEEYASRAVTDFECTDANRAIIEDIVTRLDGLPLAIELAANRMRTLSVKQLQERLVQRFRLLARRGHDPEDRQATMRAAIGWSWDLLNPVEQSVFAQCSIFRGGFVLEAAESIIDMPTADVLDLDEVICALVDKHLLHRTAPMAGMVRFSMFESLREFASEKLSTTEQITLKTRYATHYASMGEYQERFKLRGVNAAQALSRYLIEGDNMKAGFDYALELGQFESAVNLSFAALDILASEGPTGQGNEVIDAMMGQPLPTELKLKVLERKIGWQLAKGQLKTVSKVVEEASLVANELGDDDALNRIRAHRAAVDAHTGHTENVAQTLEAALSVAQANDDQISQAAILYYMACIMELIGDTERAETFFRKTIAFSQTRGDMRLYSSASSNYANLLDNLGRIDEAEAMYSESMRICRQLGNRANMAYLAGNLAFLYANSGRYDEAMTQYEIAIKGTRDIGNKRAEAYVVGNLGDLYISLGRLGEAAGHLKQAIDLCDQHGDLLGAGAFRGSLGLILAKKGDLALALETVQRGAEQLAGLDLIEQGKIMCKQGQIELLNGQEKGAQRSLEQAQELALKAGATPGSALGRAIDALQTLCHGP